jgi:hypothetical protein
LRPQQKFPAALYPQRKFLLKGGMTVFARSISRRIIGPARA